MDTHSPPPARLLWFLQRVIQLQWPLRLLSPWLGKFNPFLPEFQDLVSALAAVEEQGESLSEADLLSLCMLLLAAGHETTTSLLGNAVLALLRHPDERRRLVGDPSLMRRAVEEVLRYDSPIQATDRVATADCEIGGHAIRKGQLVGLILGAANRDPEQFDAPERFDVGREKNDHLAFGHGTHFCLGASLARAEAQIALAALLQRFPCFDGDPEPAARKRSLVLRGPTVLPLRLYCGGTPTAGEPNSLVWKESVYGDCREEPGV